MNKLSGETSPYLLQHRYNPVHWMPWGEEAWKRAQQEDKLVLVSIGYSACHWCHVMEHESFEDPETAALMNAHFVCIKVDREERPDIDQVYMEAVQAMHGSGGWPLNCFALPDGRPIHGGTYFRNGEWKHLLNSLDQFYKNRKNEALEYATRLKGGLEKMRFTVDANITFSPEKMDSIMLAWQNTFDVSEGGMDRAPKFPLPNNYLFLLHFSLWRKHGFFFNFLHLTLQKMAQGGLYDQVGGGFARYSVDRHWHVPHFEKMLYDNAQLITLYSAAARLSQEAFYLKVVDDTVRFIQRELQHPEGGFYSALDADSEGVEGKYYTWNKEEFMACLSALHLQTPKAAHHIANLYQITETGNWPEEETNIPHALSTPSEYAQREGLDPQLWEQDLSLALARLLECRELRVRPGLDNKLITSWNALMIKGLADAWAATQQDVMLQEAQRHYRFIKENLWVNGYLHHTWHAGNREARSYGFLDDHVLLADAALTLYQSTFQEQYLLDAQTLIETCLAEFIDEETGMYFYTGIRNEALYLRKHEIYDQVIPASNSVLATVLYKLGLYFHDSRYTRISLQMLQRIQSRFAGYPGGYTQWMQLQLLELQGVHLVCLTGPEALALRKEFNRHYLPQVLFAGGTSSAIPVMQGKESSPLPIQVCSGMACLPPVSTVAEALKLLQNEPSSHLD